MDSVTETLVALCKAFRGFYAEDFMSMLPSLLERFCTKNNPPADYSEAVGAVAECLNFLHFDRCEGLPASPAPNQMYLNTFAADTSAKLLLPIAAAALSDSDQPNLRRNATFLCGTIPTPGHLFADVIFSNILWFVHTADHDPLFRCSFLSCELGKRSMEGSTERRQ